MLKDIDEASELLGRLGTGGKLRILIMLGDKERSIAEIAEATGLSHKQVSRRLQILGLFSASGSEHGIFPHQVFHVEKTYRATQQAMEPKDLTLLRSVLEQICKDRDICANGKGANEVARELITLWHAGFRSRDELKSMLMQMKMVG